MMLSVVIQSSPCAVCHMHQFLYFHFCIFNCMLMSTVPDNKIQKATCKYFITLYWENIRTRPVKFRKIYSMNFQGNFARFQKAPMKFCELGCSLPMTPPTYMTSFNLQHRNKLKLRRFMSQKISILYHVDRVYSRNSGGLTYHTSNGTFLHDLTAVNWHQKTAYRLECQIKTVTNVIKKFKFSLC